jgi:hypothetical protein
MESKVNRTVGRQYEITALTGPVAIKKEVRFWDRFDLPISGVGL